MEGKSLSKKAIIAIVIIAILVIAAISMVVVFLRDQGETEATAIGENSSNSEQTQDAVPENNGDNNNQGTATQSEEPQQEEQTTVADNDGATTTDVGTTTPATTTTTAPAQQTTTTTDGSTQVATTTTTETIPTQALTLAWSNMTVSGGELLANLDADVTDVTAPVRLATNILKDGESNDLREYYVKRGDTIYMYIAVNEELAHNPTFTLINNGTEYVMEDSLVTVRQSAENRWDYSVKYLIPEDTTFVDGEITLRVSNIEDVAGNSIQDENGPTNGHRVFYDGTAPRIIVKGTENINEPDEQYVGDATQKIFSKVSFKFNDNLMLKGEYEVNDTLITGMTPATFGDANFSVIEKYLVQGLNKIRTWDMAGNEVTYEFTYDSIAPVYSKLGILNKTRYVNDVKDVTYAKRGDEVRILISFPERLAVEPTVKVFGKEYTATYRPLSSNPEQNIYYYMVDFTLDETMPEGEIPFEVYGYADIAGNVGEKLDQTRINRDEYPRVIYDRTKPVVKLEGTGVNNYFRSDVIITAEDANLGTIHLRRNGELVKNYELGTPLTEEGNYEVVMSDKAGNKSEQINFTIDKTVPVITLEGTGVNNNFRTDVKAIIEEENVHNIKYKKDDERWITVNEKELTFTEEGTYTVEVIDLAYNRTEVTFTIDKTVPVITLEGTGVNNNFRTDVKATIEEENVHNIKYKKDDERWITVNEKELTFTDEGTYTIEVIDQAYNRTEVTFTIDKTAPVITLEGTGVNNNFRTDVKAIIEEENVHNIKYRKDDGRWITVNEKELTFTDEGTYTIEVIDQAYNRTEVTFTIDKTAPALRELRVQNFYNPTGNQNYSGLTQNPRQNKGIAITVNTTELLDKNPIIVIGGKEIEVPVQEPQFNKYVVYVDITEDMNLVEGEKIPVTVKGLVDLAGNTGDEVTTTGNDNYYVIFDRTAPKTLANNILKLGESNEQREYYVRPGDSIYMCYTANEELGHNPTFTLINNGKEYVMEDSQVIVKQNPAKAWDYTVIYEIPEDTTFVDGEIELKVSNIEDKAGNKREDVKGPTNGHKVFFDTTAPEKLNLGIARNIDNGDTRDQRYAKAGDSIRVLVSFPEKLAVEPKVEMFGKVYDVTYRPDSSIEESNIYYYMADVKIDQNTPEGEVAFKVYGYKDVAGNEGEPLTNADINDGKYTNVIIDNTKPTIEPTEDSISGSEGNYSRIGFKVTDDNGVASYEINGETLILTNGEISYEALKSYLKEGVNTVVASDEAGNTAEYTFNYDAVAPTREYSNIMVNGDDSTKHEFYAKIGDKLWVSIGVKEELAHNPSFTLINNGVEYPMDGKLVKANYDEKNDRYSYVLIYEIPEGTAFVDGEITFKISDLVDLFGNKMTDETKPSNGNRVFFDKTPATIKLNGTEEPITIEAGSEYVDAGATVTDNIDGFISSNYQFTYANYYADPNSDKVTESRLTEIDTRKTGLYKIAYIYTDKAGNTKQATRYLYIKDTTMPTVTLNGEENITIEAGTPYKDEGAKVTDNSDPTIENFKYTNINYYVNGELKKSHLTEVDVKQPGEYKIGYEYTDKSGNTKITVRTVIVKDTTAPVITANGKSQTLKVGDTYTELGATLTDNAYIDADDYEITIHFYDENGKLVYPSPSKVDTSKVGEYRIAYTAKDSSGNASNVATISVKVER